MSLIVQFAKIALKEYFLIAKTSEPDILKKNTKKLLLPKPFLGESGGEGWRDTNKSSGKSFWYTLEHLIIWRRIHYKSKQISSTISRLKLTMNEDWDEETELFLLNLISFWWGAAFQLPMNIYNALNLRKVLSGITSKYLSIEVLTSEIFCVVYQLNKEGEKERKKKGSAGGGRKPFRKNYFWSCTRSLLKLLLYYFGIPKLPYFNPN